MNALVQAMTIMRRLKRVEKSQAVKVRFQVLIGLAFAVLKRLAMSKVEIMMPSTAMQA